MALDDEADGGAGDSVNPRQIRFVHASSELRPDLSHLRLGQLAVPVIRASSPGLWMFARTVPVSARKPLGMQPGPVHVSSRLGLRMQPRAVAVSSGHAVAIDAGRIPVTSERAAFADHVRGVVGLSTKEQVRRIAARRIVAAVEDKETVRNGTVHKLPSKAMCPIAAHLKCKMPVSAAKLASNPEPASIRPSALINASPEIFRRVLSHDATPYSPERKCARLVGNQLFGSEPRRKEII
jgi:hypothetical protein